MLGTEDKVSSLNQSIRGQENNFADQDQDHIEKDLGCLYPCTYNEYNIVKTRLENNYFDRNLTAKSHEELIEVMYNSDAH